MGDATVESLLSQALGSLSFAMDNVEEGIDGNALAHIKDAKRDIRAALRSDSPVRDAEAAIEQHRREVKRLNERWASTGGERDMEDWRPAWRVVEQAEDGTVTIVELDGEMFQRLPRQVGDPNGGE